MCKNVYISSIDLLPLFIQLVIMLILTTKVLRKTITVCVLFFTLFSNFFYSFFKMSISADTESARAECLRCCIRLHILYKYRLIISDK